MFGVTKERSKLEKANIQTDRGMVFLSCMLKNGLKSNKEISDPEHLALVRLRQLENALKGHDSHIESRDQFLANLLDILDK